MKICVIGAGNIGLVLSSVLALQNKYKVVLYTKKEFNSKELTFKDMEKSSISTGMDFEIESNLKIAVENADYIFCTYPAFLRKKLIKDITPFISPNTKLGFIPGYGGAEYFCKPLIDAGITVFGLQRVPFVARQEDCKTAYLLSRKNEIFIACIPKNKTAAICKEVGEMLGIPAVALKEYLSVTLTPSNPLLHLCGLYNVFKNYEKGDFFEKQLMFYPEWNDETSDLLLEYDAELQSICSKLKPLNLEEVVSLKVYYESPTASQMTKKLQSIKAFEVVKVPLIEKNGKFYPDFNSRMFVEDFPYGIAIIKYFAILTDTKTPAIDKILKFYKDKTGICYFNDDGSPAKDFKDTGIPANFGLNKLEDIINFYIQ